MSSHTQEVMGCSNVADNYWDLQYRSPENYCFCIPGWRWQKDVWGGDYWIQGYPGYTAFPYEEKYTAFSIVLILILTMPANQICSVFFDKYMMTQKKTDTTKTLITVPNFY